MLCKGLSNHGVHATGSSFHLQETDKLHKLRLEFHLQVEQR